MVVILMWVRRETLQGSRVIFFDKRRREEWRIAVEERRISLEDVLRQINSSGASYINSIPWSFRVGEIDHLTEEAAHRKCCHSQLLLFIANRTHSTDPDTKRTEDDPSEVPQKQCPEAEECCRKKKPPSSTEAAQAEQRVGHDNNAGPSLSLSGHTVSFVVELKWDHTRRIILNYSNSSSINLPCSTIRMCLTVTRRLPLPLDGWMDGWLDEVGWQEEATISITIIIHPPSIEFPSNVFAHTIFDFDSAAAAEWE